MIKLKNFKFVAVFFTVAVLLLILLLCAKNINGQSENSVFVARDNKIWEYKNGAVSEYTNAERVSNIKCNGNTLYWLGRESDDSCYINLVDTDNNENTKINTDFNVYDLILDGGYLILSGVDNTDYSYSIIAKNIQSGKEFCVSNTQNNQMEFDCYNGDVYFFEPGDDNKLYKYNIESKEKIKVSDLIQNNSSVRMNLSVNDDGIFFTKADFSENDEETNLYKLLIDENKIVTVAENIDGIIGYNAGFLYCVNNTSEPNTIHKTDVKTGIDTVLFSNKSITNASVQGDYLVCESLNLTDENEDKFFIVDTENGKVVKEW